MPPDTSPADDHIPLRPLDFSTLLVLSQGPEYGYGLVKRISERSAGGIRLAPSNLYHVLDRMIDAGLVREVEPDDRPDDARRRRYYGITPLGREVLRLEARRMADVVGTATRLDLIGGDQG